MKAKLLLLGMVIVCGACATPALADVELPPFQLLDGDGNGFVDQEEARRAGLEREVFLAADKTGDARVVPWEYRDFARLDAEQRRIAKRFEALDRDGNGVLTRREIGESVAASWESADRNSDGRLDRSEFAALEREAASDRED